MDSERSSDTNSFWDEHFMPLKRKSKHEYFLPPAYRLIAKEIESENSLPLFDWNRYDESIAKQASPDAQWDRLEKLVSPAQAGDSLLDQVERYQERIATLPGSLAAGDKQRELKAMRLRAVHTVIDAMSRVSDINYAIAVGTARIPENEHSLVEYEMSLFVRRRGNDTELCIGILQYEDFVAAKRQGYMDLCEQVAKDYVK